LLALLQPLPSASSANVSDGVRSYAEHVTEAFQCCLGVCSNVVDVISRHERALVSAFDLRGAVGVPVHLVLGLCSPSQIFRPVIRGVAVNVAALHPGRPRPVERLADHVRSEFLDSPTIIGHERNSNVPLGKRIALQDSLLGFVNANDAPVRPEQVFGESRYGSGFHDGSIGTPDSRVQPTDRQACCARTNP
jgi:hypothetical protein